MFIMKGVVDCDGSRAGVINSAWCTSCGRLCVVLLAQFCLYFFMDKDFSLPFLFYFTCILGHVFV